MSVYFLGKIQKNIPKRCLLKFLSGILSVKMRMARSENVPKDRVYTVCGRHNILEETETA